MKEKDLILCNLSDILDYDGDFFYKVSMKYTDWRSPTADLEKKVDFLNQFRCRLHSSIPGFFLSLKELLERSEKQLVALRRLQIEETDFGSNQSINVGASPLSDVIKEVYSELSSGEVKSFRFTAASKFLHMTCPDLLVMVDSELGTYLKRHGVVEKYFTQDGYIGIHTFIKNELEELIQDVMDNHGFDREQAKNYLRQKDKNCMGSLPRLIEKHFFYLSLTTPDS